MTDSTLKELDLDVSYRSDTANIVAAFYVPCMARSCLYQRAVGYFTSHSLELAAQGIAHLASKGGRVQLVASPHLSPEDIDAIERGYADRDAIVQKAAARTFSAIRDDLMRDRLGALAWLIAEGQLDVRLALRRSEKYRAGIYHEKMGIFTDVAGDMVAFSGSSNETSGGLADNFEVIDTFWSWNDPQGRVRRKLDQFEKLWNDLTPGLEVVEFTRAACDILGPFRPSAVPKSDPAEDAVSPSPNGHPQVPRDLNLRIYQEDVIRGWLATGGRGTMKMATGTGKTFTALAALVRLRKTTDIRAAIVIVPFKHLVTQWDVQCRRFGFSPLLAYEHRTRWYEPLAIGIYNAKRDRDRFIAVVVTNATFASDGFQRLLTLSPPETLIIADEVHNMGAEWLRLRLPEHVTYRLGLSATPERWFDEEGSNAILSYFGPTVQPEVTLREAIKSGALVPYRYFPRLVPLTEDERDLYVELTQSISRFNSTDGVADDPILRALLLKRARLIAVAKNKLPILADLLASHVEDSHMLFYCGDGRIEDPDGSCQRQIEAVCELVGGRLGIRVATYTAETATRERSRLLSELDSGALQGLVAIRCLDEGVDLPSIRTAFLLASSSNPRQFIQRRGRILRPSAGKDYAEIHDLVVIPPVVDAASDIDRALLRKELVRYMEFADLSMNAGSARAVILDLQKQYGLLDM